MRKISLTILFFILLINSSHALDYDSMIEGQKSTSICVELSFDSELRLPSEGDSVNIEFIMTPYLESIETNESFVVLYFLDSPNGEFYRHGIGIFPEGPYEKGKNYYTHTIQNFDTPGIWTLNYFVVKNDGFKNNSVQDFRDLAPFRTKRIRVLSYYEASSIISSNNSSKLSILGIAVTFFVFLLGLFYKMINDRRKLSPKVKVNCYNGFTVDDESSIRTFTIKAINHGNISVTLSGVGLELKNTDEIMTITGSEIVPLEFPKELLPGKSYEIIRDYERLKYRLDGKIPKRAFIRDQTEKKYYSKNIEKMFKS